MRKTLDPWFKGRDGLISRISPTAQRHVDKNLSVPTLFNEIISSWDRDNSVFETNRYSMVSCKYVSLPSQAFIMEEHGSDCQGHMTARSNFLKVKGHGKVTTRCMRSDFKISLVHGENLQSVMAAVHLWPWHQTCRHAIARNSPISWNKFTKIDILLPSFRNIVCQGPPHITVLLYETPQ